MARDPLLVIRCPPDLRARIDADADNRGTTVSEAVRSVLGAHYDPPTRAPHQPAKPRPRPAGNPKAGICEHRVRSGAYCRRCDRVI